MLRSIVIKMFKSYVIDSINTILTKNKDNVGVICENINFWCTHLTIIVEQLKKISSRCSDGNIEDDEIKESIKEVEKIISEWGNEKTEK